MCDNKDHTWIIVYESEDTAGTHQIFQCMNCGINRQLDFPPSY